MKNCIIVGVYSLLVSVLLSAETNPVLTGWDIGLKNVESKTKGESLLLKSRTDSGSVKLSLSSENLSPLMIEVGGPVAFQGGVKSESVAYDQGLLLVWRETNSGMLKCVLNQEYKDNQKIYELTEDSLVLNLKEGSCLDCQTLSPELAEFLYRDEMGFLKQNHPSKNQDESSSLDAIQRNPTHIHSGLSNNSKAISRNPRVAIGSVEPMPF